jgi:hypothetical protein
MSEIGQRTVLIAIALDEKLRLVDVGQGIEAEPSGRCAQPHQVRHAIVLRTDRQPDHAPERESTQNDSRSGVFGFEPVERRTYVLGLSLTVAERARRTAHTAVIESQHGVPESTERLRGSVDDPIVHTAAVERVGMTHDHGVLRDTGISPVEPLEPSVRSIEAEGPERVHRLVFDSVRGRRKGFTGATQCTSTVLRAAREGGSSIESCLAGESPCRTFEA